MKVQNHTDFSADPNPHMVGPDSGDFHVSGCGSNVDGGNDCTASVTFSPSSQGPESATLQFDGASFDFTGTGAQPVDVQPLSLDFGDQHVGTNSASQPVTVTNNRSQAIGVSITNGNSADYNVKRAAAASSPRMTAARSWSSSRRTRSGSRTAH